MITSGINLQWVPKQSMGKTYGPIPLKILIDRFRTNYRTNYTQHHVRSPFLMARVVKSITISISNISSVLTHILPPQDISIEELFFDVC